MTDRINLKKIVLNYEIAVYAQKVGEDWSIMVSGGCTPHVGSVSLAEYNDGAVVVRSILRKNHKDQIVGEKFAQEIACRGRCNVCVCCGIHYENPHQNDLEAIVATTNDLLAELCVELETACN